MPLIEIFPINTKFNDEKENNALHTLTMTLTSLTGISVNYKAVAMQIDISSKSLLSLDELIVFTDYFFVIFFANLIVACAHK